MKVEIVSNFEDPAGLVTGTLTTCGDRAIATTGEGQAILTAFAVLSDPDTHNAVRPCDGDAYLQALLSMLSDGYVFARIADQASREMFPPSSTGDTGE